MDALNSMTMFDTLLMILISIILIVGVYQFYFFPQNHPLKEPRELSTKADDKIPFIPSWAWLYSGLYYPMIISLVFSINSFQQYVYIAVNFLLLAFIQILLFTFYPVVTPARWRDFSDDSVKSRKFLKYIQSFDAPTNCFPSMHVSVAMMTSLHMINNGAASHPVVVAAIWLFPVFIAISCLLTKQHYIVDTIVGALLGAFVFWLYVV
jgi:membrane-associated phospholipid phosphatase